MVRLQTITYTIPSQAQGSLYVPPFNISEKKAWLIKSKKLSAPKYLSNVFHPNPFKNSTHLPFVADEKCHHSLVINNHLPRDGWVRFVQVSIWEFDPIYLPPRPELSHTSVEWMLTTMLKDV